MKTMIGRTISHITIRLSFEKYRPTNKMISASKQKRQAHRIGFFKVESKDRFPNS